MENEVRSINMSFDEWYKSIDPLKVPMNGSAAWDACSKEYEHKIANIEQAKNMKIKILEKQLLEAKCVVIHAHEIMKDIDQTLEAQKTRIKDAEEVIAFYADKKNWESCCAGTSLIESDIEYLANDIPGAIHWDAVDQYGGKRAREYQKQWEIK